MLNLDGLCSLLSHNSCLFIPSTSFKQKKVNHSFSNSAFFESITLNRMNGDPQEKDKSLERSREPSQDIPQQAGQEELALSLLAQPVESEYKKQYDHFFETIAFPTIQQICQQLQQHQIKFNPALGPQDQNLQKQIRQTNWESTAYSLKIGNFTLPANILRVNLTSMEFSKIQIGSGHFGRVCSILFAGHKYALKLIQFSQSDTNAYIKALEELCFVKIASALNVGPTFYPIFGYDAILFNDGLEFAMEQCQELSEVEVQKDFNDLKRGLRILHSVGICHSDIKPDNICWSPSRNKIVFLDFGLSQLLSQPIGNKSYSQYRGTLFYAMPELKKLYILGQRGWIDWYYCDVFALKKIQSLGHLKSSTQQSNSTAETVQCEEYGCSEPSQYFPGLIFKLKYLIFVNQVSLISQTIDYHLSKNMIFIESVKKLLLEQWRLLESKSINGLTNQAKLDRQQTVAMLISLFRKIDKTLTHIVKAKEQYSYYNDMRVVGYLEGVYNGKGLPSIRNQIIQEGLCVRSLNLLGCHWRLTSEWMEQLFYIIFVERSKRQFPRQFPAIRRNLINKIYRHTHPTSTQTNQILKLHEVLMEFTGYFLSEGFQKLHFLHHIKSCFILMSNYEKSDIIERRLIDMAQPRKKIRLLFQYFLQKTIFFNDHGIHCFNNNYESQLRGFLQDSGNEYQKFHIHIHNMLILMQSIITKKYFNPDLLDYELYEGIFQDFRDAQLISNDIQMLLRFIFIQKQKDYQTFDECTLKMCQMIATPHIQVSIIKKQYMILFSHRDMVKSKQTVHNYLQSHPFFTLYKPMHLMMIALDFTQKQGNLKQIEQYTKQLRYLCEAEKVLQNPNYLFNIYPQIRPMIKHLGLQDTLQFLNNFVDGIEYREFIGNGKYCYRASQLKDFLSQIFFISNQIRKIIEDQERTKKTHQQDANINQQLRIKLGHKICNIMGQIEKYDKPGCAIMMIFKLSVLVFNSQLQPAKTALDDCISMLKQTEKILSVLYAVYEMSQLSSDLWLKDKINQILYNYLVVGKGSSVTVLLLSYRKISLKKIVIAALAHDDIALALKYLLSYARFANLWSICLSLVLVEAFSELVKALNQSTKIQLIEEYFARASIAQARSSLGNQNLLYFIFFYSETKHNLERRKRMVKLVICGQRRLPSQLSHVAAALAKQSRKLFCENNPRLTVQLLKKQAISSGQTRAYIGIISNIKIRSSRTSCTDIKDNHMKKIKKIQACIKSQRAEGEQRLMC